MQKIAEFSARRVHSDRGLTNINPLRDVMSDTSRHRHDYSVGSIYPSDDGEIDPDVLDALADRGPDPADEATLKVDVDEWMETLDEKQRRVAEELAIGRNTTDVALKRGVSRTRIWQRREDLKEAWDQFQDS